VVAEKRTRGPCPQASKETSKARFFAWERKCDYALSPGD